MLNGTLLPVLFSLLFAIVTSGGNAVIVNTALGAIEGFSDTAFVDGHMKPLTKFLGIPYAEPPVGDNRFKKPVPKRSFNGTYQASTLPSSCFTTDKNKFIKSEDCLYLSIYVPGEFQNVTSLPVIVWIHGGGFKSGTSAAYNGDVLATYGDVIVVTLNYRLGALGWLRSADGTFIGNQGLWDQQLAIQWVQQNIQNFNGHPNEITVFGESAGSISAIAQSMYAGNKGLIKRVIGQSGSVFEGMVTNYSNAGSILNQTGCATSPDPEVCLRNISAEQLMNVKSSYNMYFPVVDGTFIVEFQENTFSGSGTMTSSAKQMFGDVDLLTGVCAMDGGYPLVNILPQLLGVPANINITIDRSTFLNKIIPIAARLMQINDQTTLSAIEKYLTFQYTDWTDPNSLTNIRNEVLNLAADETFFRGMIRTVREHSTINRGRTYVYELSVTPTHHAIETPYWIKGSNHADDLQYMFGYPLNTKYPGRVSYTEQEKNVSRAMMTMWTNFAKTGDPNLPNDAMHFLGATWPEYDMTSRNYLEITERLSDAPIKQGFYPKRMALWLDVFPELIRSQEFAPIG